MYKIEQLKNQIEMYNSTFKKLDIHGIDIVFNKDENVFIISNKEGSIKFDINDCYNILTLSNTMFNICVSGIEGTEETGNIIGIGRIN